MKKQLNPAPIGIDLGSYKSKIAVAKRGGVQIITNEANFRQTPCVVGFGASERNIGEAGFIKMKSNFRDTIVAPQKFVGLPTDYPNIRSELKHCPCKYDLGSGKIQFSVNYQGQKQNLVPQQALAAYFNKLKSIMEHNEFQSKEAVIAVPTYLTQAQRKGILNAAKIAELNVTRLLNESTAVGLEYGIFRKNDLDAKTPRNVLFLDFGHSTFGLYCCSFTKQQMNVLYQDYERNLGCRDLDHTMYEFYRSNFEKTSGGCDVSQNRKAVVKLMQNIQRQRKILSGNTQFEMNIQYLMEENDLHYTMKRDEFNQVCKPIFSRMHQVMVHAREKLKQKGIQIHSVELVGGGTRIPQFLRIAKEAFGHEPSRTLNSSECVARGAALMAAIKSPLFRVAEYTLNEKSHYGIKFSWNFVEGNHFLGTNSEQYPQKQRKMIFEAGSKIPSSKTIKFARKQAIQILIQYEPPVPGFNKHIAYFVTKPQHPKQETFGVQFKLKYTEDGLIAFSDCSLIQQWTQQTKIPKKKQTKPADTANQTGEKKEGEGSQPPAPAPVEQQFEIKKTKKQKLTEVKYDSNHFDTYSEKDIHDFFTLESTMCNQDRILIQTYEKKNELESLSYNWKQKLQGSHREYAKPQTIPDIVAFLQQTSQWLYGEGNESNRGTYASKIQQVQGKILDIQRRYESFEQVRNELIILMNTLKSCFDACNSLVNLKQFQDKQYQHITPEQRQVVINEIEGIKNWVHSAEKNQQSRPKWENPVISGNDIRNKIKEINDKTKKLLSKPVPKKQEPKVENPSGASTKMDEQKSAGQSTKMDEQKK